MNLHPDLEKRLQQLLKVFLEENTKLNLSALRTEDACWNGNILDSLAFLELVDRNMIKTPTSLIDIGTGGGFPLLPLALALPQTQCTGLDSTGKKVEAVRRIVEQLHITNVQLITDRAEPAGQKSEYRATYDIVTSRAVAPLSILLELTVPFAKTGGHIVLWKSLHIDEELKASENAQKILECTLQKHQYDLGGDWGTRQLLVFTKNAETPRMYPRAVGEPKKSPI